MSLKSTYQIVGVCTVILSFFSIIGSSYIIYTAYQKRKDKKNRDFIVNDYVYFMSYCDLCGALQVLLYWSSVASDSSWIARWPNALCTISGFIFQFVLVSSATWNFFISINLVRLVAFKASPLDLKYESNHSIAGVQIKYNHVIVWMLALLASLIPITNYGFTPNAEEKEGFAPYECWIDDKDFQLCLYALIFAYVAVTICILFWILLQKFDIISSSNIGIQQIQNRLAAYSLLFVIIWIFPLAARCYTFVGLSAPPFFVVMHHLLLASVGIGNAFIWTCLPTEYAGGEREDDSAEDMRDEDEIEAGRKRDTMGEAPKVEATQASGQTAHI